MDTPLFAWLHVATFHWMFGGMSRGESIGNIYTGVDFSPWLRICSWLELRDKGIVSYVPQVREEQMVRICLYAYVCVAPPMIVGAWSMAVMLWQLHDNIYTERNGIFPKVVKHLEIMAKIMHVFFLNNRHISKCFPLLEIYHFIQ